MRRTKTQHDRIGDEEPSPFHYLKTQLRRETETIREVRDSQGNNITQSQGVIQTFLTHLRRRNQPIPTNDDDFRRLKDLIQPVNPWVYAALLETPLRRRKSSPSCGQARVTKHLAWMALALSSILPIGTLKADLLAVINHMFMENSTTPTKT